MSTFKGKFLENSSVDGTKIRLANAQPLRARNTAGNADISIWLLNALDKIVAGADLDLNSKKITGLPTPTTSSEPTTKGYTDDLVANSIANLSVNADTIAALALKSDITYVDAQLALKADASTTTTALATKASSAAVAADLAALQTSVTAEIGTATSGKADTTTVDSALALKSDITYVDDSISTARSQITNSTNIALASKADATATTNALQNKTSFAYVDAADALKANSADVTTEIAAAISGKADTTYVDTQDGLKVNITDFDTAVGTINTAIGTKASSSSVTSGLALKANITDVDTALALKANSADVTTAIAASAASIATDIATAVAPKADTTTVNTALALKADTTTVNTALALKASTSSVNTALALKSDITYVDSGLSVKVDLADMNTALALKADASTTTSALALKASISYVDSSVSPKANTTDVDTALALKASIAYVDSQVSGKASTSDLNTAIQGLAPKAPVRVATTAALPSNTYSNGVITASANGLLPAIDGVANLADSDRILVKNESASANNGIYVITSIGLTGAPFVLTRSSDATTGAQLKGAYVFSQEGAVNADHEFLLATDGVPTVGTTALTWGDFGTAVSYSAGNGISITSGVIAVALGGGLEFLTGNVQAKTQGAGTLNTTGLDVGGAIKSLKAVKENRALSGTDITNGYIDLANVAHTGSIQMNIVGGYLAAESTDYTVGYTSGASSKSRITFAGELTTLLDNTDSVAISYQTL